MEKTKKITKKHRVITDQCRKNHGDFQALNIALEDMRLNALESMSKFPDGVKIHLKLEIERPIDD